MDQSEKPKKGFIVVYVNEFSRQHNLSDQEAFWYLFKYKGSVNG